MKPIIKVENLSKQYRIGVRQASYSTLRDSITEKLRAPFDWLRRNGNHEGGAIWALRDVSFEVAPGEIVGVIGRNGAGKSTLLKILSRITEPTIGQVDIYGRVGSLLEVGTGFHPELSGRENVYLNGAILGMKRSEIDRKFDEIVAFAEIEKFIDTTVKHYSSGMYMRLAFAVAAHLEPEILLVDEVLAVGDANFQKKCLGKMREVGMEGRTVLFISHNMTALQSLCDRALWLDSGRLKDDGWKNGVVSKYLQTTASAVTEQVWNDPDTAPGNECVRMHLARLCLDCEAETDVITVQIPLRMEFKYWNRIHGAKLNLSLHLYNLEGVCIFNSISETDAYDVGLVGGTCYIPGDLLNDGIYRAMIMIVRDRSVPLYTHDDILVFEVNDVERESGWLGKWSGALRPKLEWKTGQILEN